MEWFNKRGEKAFCTFSQQLNNPHALWIDRLPREIEKGRDGEKGKKRGREGESECSAPREHAALYGIVMHFVCVHRECGEIPCLALARGPTLQGFCG